ncbi:hypothetical protein THAOC_16946, partial [Thalassiosira oceanica]
MLTAMSYRLATVDANEATLRVATTTRSTRRDVASTAGRQRTVRSSVASTRRDDDATEATLRDATTTRSSRRDDDATPTADSRTNLHWVYLAQHDPPSCTDLSHLERSGASDSAQEEDPIDDDLSCTRQHGIVASIDEKRDRRASSPARVATETSSASSGSVFFQATRVPVSLGLAPPYRPGLFVAPSEPPSIDPPKRDLRATRTRRDTGTRTRALTARIIFHDRNPDHPGAYYVRTGLTYCSRHATSAGMSPTTTLSAPISAKCHVLPTCRRHVGDIASTRFWEMILGPRFCEVPTVIVIVSPKVLARAAWLAAGNRAGSQEPPRGLCWLGLAGRGSSFTLATGLTSGSIDPVRKDASLFALNSPGESHGGPESDPRVIYLRARPTLPQDSPAFQVRPRFPITLPSAPGAVEGFRPGGLTYARGRGPFSCPANRPCVHRIPSEAAGLRASAGCGDSSIGKITLDSPKGKPVQSPPQGKREPQPSPVPPGVRKNDARPTPAGGHLVPPQGDDRPPHGTVPSPPQRPALRAHPGGDPVGRPPEDMLQVREPERLVGRPSPPPRRGG